jgi:S1-C subfamily serine protease
MPGRMRRLCAVSGLTFCLASALPADEARTRAAARDVVAKHADAVITVRLTVKTRMVFQGRERNSGESTLEIAGTVLSASGLTAVSDFTSNPSALFQNQPEGPRLDTETTDVKLVLRDGRELPARFVLRDQDLDLAFLMPEDKATTLPYLTLEKGQVPKPLDDLILLYPMGKALNREIAVTTASVRAVVKKPRTFVVAEYLSGFQSLGGPAFNETGHAVGLVVLRRAAVPPTAGGGIRDMLDLISPVVLTAEDVLQVAAQAVAPKAND